MVSQQKIMMPPCLLKPSLPPPPTRINILGYHTKIIYDSIVFWITNVLFFMILVWLSRFHKNHIWLGIFIRKGYNATNPKIIDWARSSHKSRSRPWKGTGLLCEVCCLFVVSQLFISRCNYAVQSHDAFHFLLGIHVLYSKTLHSD